MSDSESSALSSLLEDHYEQEPEPTEELRKEATATASRIAATFGKLVGQLEEVQSWEDRPSWFSAVDQERLDDFLADCREAFNAAEGQVASFSEGLTFGGRGPGRVRVQRDVDLKLQLGARARAWVQCMQRARSRRQEALAKAAAKRRRLAGTPAAAERAEAEPAEAEPAGAA
ncbi:unnamed protein product [Symbiodinium necroappetens]|uniref:Uncharacterized protein n=1 Tax=Symbiodinium necroappetens TaxID=1628268 RepID=A0A812UIP4_9DINO|nr:unnamed protein product [Symbiodinium necroappetens]